jgi:hypothetical protein
MALSWLRNESVKITSVRLMTIVCTTVLINISVVSSTKLASVTLVRGPIFP